MRTNLIEEENILSCSLCKTSANNADSVNILNSTEREIVHKVCVCDMHYDSGKEFQFQFQEKKKSSMSLFCTACRKSNPTLVCLLCPTKMHIYCAKLEMERFSSILVHAKVTGNRINQDARSDMIFICHKHHSITNNWRRELIISPFFPFFPLFEKLSESFKAYLSEIDPRINILPIKFSLPQMVMNEAYGNQNEFSDNFIGDEGIWKKVFKEAGWKGKQSLSDSSQVYMIHSNVKVKGVKKFFDFTSLIHKQDYFKTSQEIWSFLTSEVKRTICENFLYAVVYYCCKHLLANLYYYFSAL
jgi:hypothetical protein